MSTLWWPRRKQFFRHLAIVRRDYQKNQSSKFSRKKAAKLNLGHGNSGFLYGKVQKNNSTELHDEPEEDVLQGNPFAENQLINSRKRC